MTENDNMALEILKLKNMIRNLDKLGKIDLNMAFENKVT